MSLAVVSPCCAFSLSRQQQRVSPELVLCTTWRPCTTLFAPSAPTDTDTQQALLLIGAVFVPPFPPTPCFVQLALTCIYLTYLNVS